MSEFTTALYVGGVYVDVGYDAIGAPKAQTVVPTLGATDLGGQISVTLGEYAFGDEDEEDPSYGSVEMWKKLLLDMRDMLARCMVLCTMQPCEWELHTKLDSTGDSEKALDQAITELQEAGELEITITHTIKALQKRAEEEERLRQGIKSLVEFTEAQQAPGEDITLGEAAERQAEGTEEVRKIVEDSDQEEDAD